MARRSGTGDFSLTDRELATDRPHQIGMVASDLAVRPLARQPDLLELKTIFWLEVRLGVQSSCRQKPRSDGVAATMIVALRRPVRMDHPSTSRFKNANGYDRDAALQPIDSWALSVRAATCPRRRVRTRRVG